MSEELDTRRKFVALSEVVQYRPIFALGLVVLSICTAVLEGIGLSFILPIIKYACGVTSSGPGGIIRVFAWVYDLFGVPFTLEFIVLGVGLVMTTRYVLSFVVAWLRISLQVDYVRHLRTESFQRAP